MTAIPEHIMEQAKDVADRLFRRSQYRDWHVAKDPERVIALALQAVDTAAEKRGKEEAARKAEIWAGELDPFLSPNAIPILRQLAAAIRGS